MSAATLSWRRGTRGRVPSKQSPSPPHTAVSLPEVLQNFEGQSGSRGVFTRTSGSLGSVHPAQSATSLSRLPVSAAGFSVRAAGKGGLGGARRGGRRGLGVWVGEWMSGAVLGTVCISGPVSGWDSSALPHEGAAPQAVGLLSPQSVVVAGAGTYTAPQRRGGHLNTFPGASFPLSRPYSVALSILHVLAVLVLWVGCWALLRSGLAE